MKVSSEWEQLFEMDCALEFVLWNAAQIQIDARAGNPQALAVVRLLHVSRERYVNAGEFVAAVKAWAVLRSFEWRRETFLKKGDALLCP